jgi:group I intron endonuclease
MKSGIYRIKNLINEKSYIGSALNINRRFSRHKNDLSKNKHHNVHLQASYNKHGKANFQFLILELCEIEELIKREQFYIDKYLCWRRSFGYNLSPTAGKYIRL